MLASTTFSATCGDFNPAVFYNMLNLSHVSFAYPHCAVLRDFSAQLAPGLALVLGGDGRGKTTTQTLLAGELPLDAGRLQLGGVFLDEQPEAYRQQVFWIDPRSTAHDALTVTDYLQSVRRAYPGFDEAVLAEVIDGLSLGPHLHKNLFMLSTGSKRKVWLAASAASGAQLTLLDGPFASLDQASINFVLQMLGEAASQSTRIWVVADYVPPGDLALTTLIDLGD
jgi:ABC-type multidrug transport system ATPase subunit